MALSKKIRFEVFKRDSFTCQYCGRKAPDVVLHCDHIEPKSKGGSNDILNLITSCFECNAGKSNRRLSDDSVVAKQREQLAQLQERKEQIEMMMEWQRSLVDLDQHVTEELASFWASLLPDWPLPEDCKPKVRQLVGKFGVEAVANAMRRTVDAYALKGENGRPDVDSVALAFDKIPGICRVTEAEKQKPYLGDLFYIRGIMRNRFNYVNKWAAMSLMERAYLAGATIDQLKSVVFENKNWSGWQDDIVALIDELEYPEDDDDGLQQD